jgi:NADH-quinone oxidoreductase subunit C
MRRLKQDLKFERLSTVTGVDRYPAEPRFEIVYHLQSVSRKERLRIKARISGEPPEIDSVCGVYRSANWYERETFDLFGVIFRHHPDLTRIMLPQDWEGHPLRKDVPVTGTRY